MKAPRMLFIAVIAFLVAGCAGTASKEQELRPNGQPKILVTDRALAYIEKNGTGIAAMKGTSRDSDLVCEVVQLPNRDVRTFCYMREEMERRNLNHREGWRELTTPGATATN